MRSQSKKPGQEYFPRMSLIICHQKIETLFIKNGAGYQIVKSIRDICVFATHNLLRDPPFSQMDIISCQNVLIYLEPNAQSRILQSFHYGLKPHGFLLLGKSETTGNSSDLFSVFDKGHNIYNKKILIILYPLIFKWNRIPIQIPG